tara:strand:- start:64 stop:414 length:351 start_codon:yes stop_codon:yes gene_type:complete
MANPNPSPENQFKPGQSGNPGGRPVGSVGLSKRIQKVLLETTDNRGKPLADILVEKLVAESLKNPHKMYAFIRDFIDRDEGKVLDKVELSGNPNNFVELIQALELIEHEEDVEKTE